MKQYSRKKLARALPQVLARYPRAEVVRLVAQELLKSRSAGELPWLLRETAAAFFAATGELSVQITAARPLSSAARERIEQLLKHLTGAAAIAGETAIDPGLLGGFTAETPTLEIDASVQEKLNALTRYARS